MDYIKKVAKVIPAGTWPDSGREETLYWLSRPPAERIAFAREMIRSTYRRMHGCDLPPVSKVAHVINDIRELK